LLIALSFTFAALYVTPAFAADGDIVAVAVKGEVRVTQAGAARAVRAGAVLTPPFVLRTGADGAVDLAQGATRLGVGPDTVLEFPALEKPGVPVDRVVQPRGKVFYDIGKRTGRKLRVETPYLVGVVKGTQFNVAALDESTTISLFEGLLEVRASDDSSVIELKAGEIASRRRGEQGISVLRMDSGKAPAPAPRDRTDAPDGGGDGGAPGMPTPDGIAEGSPVLVDGGFIAPPLDSPGVDLDVGGRDGGAAVEVAVNAPPAAVSVDAVVDVGNVADVTVDAGVDVAVGNGGAAVEVNASVGAALPALDVASDVGVDAAVDLGGGAVDAAVGAAVDVGEVANVVVDVGAEVALDSGVAASVDVNAGANAGPLSAGLETGVAVDLGTDQGAAAVDLGTNVNAAVGDISADVGVDAGANLGAEPAVAVDAGASVAGIDAGANAAVDLGSGTVDLGVDVAGVNLDVGVDLGLGADTDTDTPATETPAAPEAPASTPTIDVGGLLDSLLRRPGRQ
jgi:hypothetical protein